MPKSRNIDFQINAKKGDFSGLESLKRDLASIQAQVSNSDWGLDIGELKRIIPTINTLQNALTKAYDSQLNTINIQKFNNILQQSGLNVKTLQQNLALAGVSGEQAFLKLTTQLMRFNTATKQTNEFLDNIAKAFFNTAKYTAFNAIFNTIGTTVSRASGYVKNLDSSLNDIRIVTGKSADEMERFAVSANKAAKQLAVTTSDYVEGSLIYYQQGLNDETVKTLTDITAMTSNVTAQSMSTVSEQLTAVWNGYQVANQAAEEGMQVYQEYVDKMAAVGATTASDLQELSSAMSKVASAASAMGVGFDDLNAQIATIVSVTRQAPESVGTALKTIYARLGDLKVDGVDEFGTQLGEVSAQLQTMGINILDTNGDMRQMSDVISEVAAKWDTWTSAQKQAAAVAMAGKRQYNNLVALFDNWDMYGEALETSMEAAGTLEKQQAIALDSLANKMDILSASAENLYDSLLNEDNIKKQIDGLTTIVDLLADFADAAGGLQNLLPLLGATGLKVFNQQIAEGLNTIIINARNAKQALSMDAQNDAALRNQYTDSLLYQFQSGDSNIIAAQKEGIAELNRYYGEMVQYRSIMNQEEKNSYNNILDMKEQIGSLNVQLENQKNLWLKTHKTLQLINGNDIVNIENRTEEVLTKVQMINQTSEAIEEKIKSVGKDEVYTKNQFKDIFSSTDLAIGDTDINKLAKRFSQLNGETRPVKEVLAIINSELKDVGNRAEDIIRVQNQMSQLRDTAQAAGESLQSSLELKRTITNITRAVGGIGQLAVGVNILSNEISILSNENLDFGEKLSQGFMAATTGLGMLHTGLQSFNGVVNLTATQIKGLTAAEEAQIAIEKVEAAQLEVNAALEAERIAKENILIAEENNLSAVKILGEQQLAAAREDITKKEILLNNAEVAASELNARAKAEATMASQGFSIAKVIESAKILLNKSALDADTAATMRNVAIKNVALGVSLLVVASIITGIKIREKQIEQIIELNKRELENIKSKEEEVKANDKLVESYNKLYEQYKNGEKVQESLYEKAIEVAKAYDIQGASILAAAGYYEELTEQIKKAQLVESERNATRAKIGAEKTANTLMYQTSGGTKRGTIGANGQVNYLGPIWMGQSLIDTSTGIYQDTANAFKQKTGKDYSSWTVDFSDPKAVKEYADQIDYMVEYTEANGDKAGHKYWSNMQKNMAETLPELEEQLDTFYTETTEIAFSTVDLASAQSATQLSNNIEEVKKKLVEEGQIAEDEIDKYVDKYLSGIDNIQENLDKIDIAKTLADKKGGDQYFDSFLESLNKFNESELAYLTVHLNDETLTEDLDAWITAHEPIIIALGEKGASSNFKSALTGFNEKTGFIESNIQGLFAEGSVTASYLPSKEEFQSLDIANQYSAITQAMIESTQAALEHKKDTIDALKAEQVEIDKLGIAYESEADTAKTSIADLVQNNDIIKDDYEDIYQLAIKLADGNRDDLGPSYDALLAKITSNGVATEDQLTQWGKSLVLARDNADASAALSKEISTLEGTQADYKKTLEGLNTQISLQNGLIDNIQTAYSSLVSIVDDYNKSGIWTIDNVQKLIEMDDRYVAALQMENGQLTLNEDAFKTMTIAKLNDLEASIDLEYQEKMLAIANKDEALSAAAAAAASIVAGSDMLTMGENALTAAQGVQILADTLKEIGDPDSEWSALAEQTEKAWEAKKKALQDARTAVAAGGDSMKKALHTGKDSSSKDKKDKELLKLDEEFDRYWEINKALDAIDRSLKKIDKDQEKLYGKELIRSLKQENELLANQAQLYEKLAAAQAQEAAELRGTLANSGVTFDASGAVLNYAQATAEALKKYNDAITAYNQGALDDAALETHKQTYERFKKDLERYDKLFYTEMKETQEKIDDIRRNMLANNLKAWEVEIDLKLNFKQLERDWNDFIKEVTSDFKKVFKDLRVEVRNMLKDATTYVGEEGSINTIIGAVKDVTGEIDKLMGGGTSDMFESVSQAQEKLKELNTELLDSSKALHDLWTQAWDNYLDGIDQVADKFDELLDRYEKINEELEFQQKLIELLYGDEAYKLMSKLYEGQEKNTAAQIQSVKQQVDMWKDLFAASGASMDNQLNWDEDQKKYYEQWMSAQSKLNDLVIEYIQLLKNDYLNTVSDVLSELEKYVTGSNLDNINTEWERIAANAEKYYDSVEGAYYIQSLANKIDQSIADSSNLQAQQKLMKLREREIDYLREKETLTEYDIKAAELRYQIALKEIALEEAQNNKTGMKLTRNEQGNWSYQYVADEEDIASKRQELLDAYNDLYQLASDAYEANLKALTELQEKYLESAKQIYEDDTLTEQERQQKLLELREWYLEQYKLLSEENQLYRNDLATAGSALLLEIYRQDEEAYEAMTEKERELVDTLVNANINDFMDLEDRLKDNYQEIGNKAKEVMSETRADWTSGAQTIADLWNKDSGWSVKTQVVKAYDAIQEANRKYKEAVDWCAAAVERNFGEEGIVGAIQNAEYETDALKDKTIELVNESIPYLDELKNFVYQIGEAWQSVQNEIMAAINLIDEYLRKVGEANQAAQQQAEIAAQQAVAEVAKKAGSNSGNGSTNNDSTTHYYYTDPYGAGNTIAETDAQGNIIRIVSSDALNSGNWQHIEPSTRQNKTNQSSKPALDWQYQASSASSAYTEPEGWHGLGKELKKLFTGSYATGGYTGDWDDSGRLAILHQKELVLNADDTKNFLSGIDMIRSMSSNNGSIEKAVLKAAANMAYSLSNITPGTFTSGVSNNSNNENVFNITAEFPNANNVDDIRQAILTLPNYASQMVNSTLK